MAKLGKRRLSVRDRLMLSGVPPSARQAILGFESRAEAQPEGMKRFGLITAAVSEGPSLYTFGLFHTGDGDVAGILLAITPDAMLVLDVNDGRIYANCQWKTMCCFDFKLDHDGEFQVGGFTYYDGEQDIEDRLDEDYLLEASELSGGYLYLHGQQFWGNSEAEPLIPLTPSIFVPLETYLSEYGIPEYNFALPPLLPNVHRRLCNRDKGEEEDDGSPNE